MKIFGILAYIMASGFVYPLHGKETCLAGLDIHHIKVGWGNPRKNLAISGTPMKIAGMEHASGIGVHTAGHMTLKLDGNATWFRCRIGIDSGVGERGEAVVVAYGDNSAEIGRSQVVKGGGPSCFFEVPLAGQKQVIIAFDACGDNAYDHLDLIDPVIVHEGEISLIESPGLSGDKYILTPPAPMAPRINPPRVIGVRPGSPLLFRVPTSGARPMRFSATGLPQGIQLDQERGVLTGTIHSPEHRSYPVTVTSRNAHGIASETVRVVVGDRIALTPPMGWNSWYVWSESINQQRMVEAARLFDSTGIADYGWTYINIDDCWQGERSGTERAIQPGGKFPDMKGSVDKIHALGLKAGIYSTPWIGSYAGFRGGSCDTNDGTYTGLPPDKRLQPGQIFGRYPGFHSFKADRVGKNWLFEADMRQISQWGFDFIKVDWKPIDIPTTERISKAVRAQPRDIVLSLSNGANIKWGSEYAKLAELWRTTGDIHDSWGSISGIGFSQFGWAEHAGPGHWNDPDMLQIGYTNTPNQLVTESRATRLTPDEQYTQVSLWAMLAAPLILSCDLTKLDPFTLNLITNPEIIGVNQDPLGRQATRRPDLAECIVMARPLEAGGVAFGVFNTHDFLPKMVVMPASELGVEPGSKVIDLWTHKILPWRDGAVSIKVPAHGCAMLRVTP